MFKQRATEVSCSTPLRPSSWARMTGCGTHLPATALAGLVLLFILLIVTSAIMPGAATFAQAPPSPLVAEGEKQFKQSCGFCHGPDATGARGPDLVRSPLVAHDVNGNLIGEVIRNGRPDKGMPPLPLSKDQITAIAAFLHDRTRQAMASSHVPRQYPLQKLLTGNAAAGKAYFDGPEVHGLPFAHRRPKGVAGKYPPNRLQTRMLYPRGDAVTPTVTVVLPSGQRLEGPLLHLDEFNVALRDGSGWYRSFPLDKVKVEVHDPLAAHRELLDKLTQQQFHDLFAYIETLK